eukprot:g2528.t1
MLEAYVRAGQGHKALEWFGNMQETGVRATTTDVKWAIEAAAALRETGRALEIFAGMRDAGLEPDASTFAAAARACMRGDPPRLDLVMQLVKTLHALVDAADDSASVRTRLSGRGSAGAHAMGLTPRVATALLSTCFAWSMLPLLQAKPRAAQQAWRFLSAHGATPKPHMRLVAATLFAQAEEGGASDDAWQLLASMLRAGRDKQARHDARAATTGADAGAGSGSGASDGEGDAAAEPSRSAMLHELTIGGTRKLKMKSSQNRALLDLLRATALSGDARRTVQLFERAHTVGLLRHRGAEPYALCFELCGLAGEWRSALRLLKEMRAEAKAYPGCTPPSSHEYMLVTRICARGMVPSPHGAAAQAEQAERWSAAKQLLAEHAEIFGQPQREIAYLSLVRASLRYDPSGAEARALLSEMETLAAEARKRSRRWKKNKEDGKKEGKKAKREGVHLWSGKVLTTVYQFRARAAVLAHHAARGEWEHAHELLEGMALTKSQQRSGKGQHDVEMRALRRMACAQVAVACMRAGEHGRAAGCVAMLLAEGLGLGEEAAAEGETAAELQRADEEAVAAAWELVEGEGGGGEGLWQGLGAVQYVWGDDAGAGADADAVPALPPPQPDTAAADEEALQAQVLADVQAEIVRLGLEMAKAGRDAQGAGGMTAGHSAAELAEVLKQLQVQLQQGGGGTGGGEGEGGAGGITSDSESEDESGEDEEAKQEMNRKAVSAQRRHRQRQQRREDERTAAALAEQRRALEGEATKVEVDTDNDDIDDGNGSDSEDSAGKRAEGSAEAKMGEKAEGDQAVLMEKAEISEGKAAAESHEKSGGNAEDILEDKTQKTEGDAAAKVMVEAGDNKAIMDKASDVAEQKGDQDSNVDAKKIGTGGELQTDGDYHWIEGDEEGRKEAEAEAAAEAAAAATTEALAAAQLKDARRRHRAWRRRRRARLLHRRWLVQNVQNEAQSFHRTADANADVLGNVTRSLHDSDVASEMLANTPQELHLSAEAEAQGAVDVGEVVNGGEGTDEGTGKDVVTERVLRARLESVRAMSRAQLLGACLNVRLRRQWHAVGEVTALPLLRSGMATGPTVPGSEAEMASVKAAWAMSNVAAVFSCDAPPPLAHATENIVDAEGETSEVEDSEEESEEEGSEEKEQEKHDDDEEQDSEEDDEKGNDEQQLKEGAPARTDGDSDGAADNESDGSDDNDSAALALQPTGAALARSAALAAFKATEAYAAAERVAGSLFEAAALGLVPVLRTVFVPVPKVLIETPGQRAQARAKIQAQAQAQTKGRRKRKSKGRGKGKVKGNDKGTNNDNSGDATAVNDAGGEPSELALRFADMQLRWTDSAGTDVGSSGTRTLQQLAATHAAAAWLGATSAQKAGASGEAAGVADGDDKRAVQAALVAQQQLETLRAAVQAQQRARAEALALCIKECTRLGEAEPARMRRYADLVSSAVADSLAAAEKAVVAADAASAAANAVDEPGADVEAAADAAEAAEEEEAEAIVEAGSTFRQLVAAIAEARAPVTPPCWSWLTWTAAEAADVDPCFPRTPALPLCHLLPLLPP